MVFFICTNNEPIDIIISKKIVEFSNIYSSDTLDNKLRERCCKLRNKYCSKLYKYYEKEAKQGIKSNIDPEKIGDLFKQSYEFYTIFTKEIQKKKVEEIRNNLILNAQYYYYKAISSQDVEINNLSKNDAEKIGDIFSKMNKIDIILGVKYQNIKERCKIILLYYHRAKELMDQKSLEYINLKHKENKILKRSLLAEKAETIMQEYDQIIQNADKNDYELKAKLFFEHGEANYVLNSDKRDDK